MCIITAVMKRKRPTGLILEGQLVPGNQASHTNGAILAKP